MAKSIIGIDIGKNSVKVCQVADHQIKKACQIDVPDNLVQNGKVVSIEAMGELLRESLNENGIKGKEAALVLNDETCFVKNVTMPKMSAEQLTINLPYEFRDYITDELKNYYFDYAMITSKEDLQKEDEEHKTMDLTAVACEKKTIEDARLMFRKAGLKLVKASPATSCLTDLIRYHGVTNEATCVLDLGYSSARIYMFKGDSYDVTKELENGIEVFDQAIAESKNVDVHLAHTYFQTNYEDCWHSEICENLYHQLTVELTRALNFYRFSNPGIVLSNIYLTGSGCFCIALIDALKEALELKVLLADELLNQDVDDGYAYAKSFGVTEGIYE